MNNLHPLLIVHPAKSPFFVVDLAECGCVFLSERESAKGVLTLPLHHGQAIDTSEMVVAGDEHSPSTILAR